MKNSSKLCLPYVTRRSLIKRQFFLICFFLAVGSIISVFENCVDSKLSKTKNKYTINPDIDDEHIAEYPYCGRMDIEFTDEPEPSVRAVNTNETDDLSIYRLVVKPGIARECVPVNVDTLSGTYFYSSILISI